MNPDSVQKYAQVPPEMRAERRWLVYKLVPVFEADGKTPVMKNGRQKMAKPPHSVRTGLRHDPTDREEWVSFEQASKAQGFDGIGFVLGDGWVGLDVDGCLDDRRRPDETALKFMSLLKGSYREVSPSGNGLHFVFKADPAGVTELIGKENGDALRPVGTNLELYSQGRYFTVTGASL